MAYIILQGKFLLHSAQLASIGTVTIGDTLGEEGLFEKKESNNKIYRREMATAENECFMLELTASSFEKLKDELGKKKLSMDWFTL